MHDLHPRYERQQLCPPQLEFLAKVYTWRQRAIIRLRVEVYLHHLAPAPRLEHFEDVSDITAPSVRVDSASHHLAMHDIEIVTLKGKPSKTSVDHCKHKINIETDLPAVQIIHL